MTVTQVILVGVAAVSVLGAVAAFVIAYRKGAEESWREGVEPEAVAVDRPLKAPVFLPETSEEAAGEQAVDAPEALPVGAPELEPKTVPVAVGLQEVVEIPPAEAGINRRQFFNRALLGTFGAYMGTFGIASLAFFWPKVTGGFGADIDAGDLDEIRSRILQPDGTITPLFVPDAKAYVVLAEPEVMSGSQFEDIPVTAGGLTALFQRCVHLGCRVPWCLSSQGFECPCHGSKYNAIGEYEAGPAPRNLDRFEVEISEDNRLIIKTAVILRTARAQVKSVEYPQGPSCIEVG